MSTLTVSVRGLSGEDEVTLDLGATAADLREAGGINPGLSLRSDGQTLEDDAPLRDDQVVVATAPEAKHGLR